MIAPVSSRPTMRSADAEPVSVVVPHGGAERLAHLATTLATLRQRAGVHEIIVVEMGGAALAVDLARRWADKHLFIKDDGAFERGRALNAAQAVAESNLILWHDNDLLTPPAFIQRAAQEMRSRRLDFLTPYTSVRYLSQSDSRRVVRGDCDPGGCRPENVLYSRSTSFGAMGLVSREFLACHGGFIEGFRGWGGEDNAWNHKVAVLGRAGRTNFDDQHVHHLFHPSSGGYAPGAAGIANPHYRDNVALMNRVAAIRNSAEFSGCFPAAVPASGKLSRFEAPPQQVERPPMVWTYWEGPCPDWIRACLRTLASTAPSLRLLTPETFDRLRDRDRDIDLSRLHVAHRADFVRAFLLQRFGGMWVDADCLVMQPLQQVLDMLSDHDMVGHRERNGFISNAFLAARPASRIAANYYARVCDVLRSRRPLGWTSIGAEPLSAVVAEDSRGWHELPCERVQPVCWSNPGAFLEEGTPAEHEKRLDRQAICYMMSNTEISRQLAANAGAALMKSSTFFSFLLDRACGSREAHAGESHEDIFARHAQIYRQYRDESISGPGSSLDQTQELRERLPLVLQNLGVRSLVDAPCGDFNWMRYLRLGVEEYIGVDIMTDVIVDNQWHYGSPARRFIRADLMQSALPRADAILCRDLLPHLTYAEIMAVLQTFRRSGATYLLTTTFTGPRPNRDTAGGEWRTLNFTYPPFNFPEPRQVIVEKCSEGGGTFADKCLGVWRFVDLPVELSAKGADGTSRHVHEIAG